MGSQQNWSASAKDLLTLVFMPPTQASLISLPTRFLPRRSAGKDNNSPTGFGPTCFKSVREYLLFVNTHKSNITCSLLI